MSKQTQSSQSSQGFIVSIPFKKVHFSQRPMLYSQECPRSPLRSTVENGTGKDGSQDRDSLRLDRNVRHSRKEPEHEGHAK